MTELEKIGLIPRSIVRMLDRFYYQLYLGTAEPLVKQFRFSKYLLLTSVKSLLVVLFIPFFINIFTKIYIFRPLVEYFWDRKQTEIFLNYELQEKAFSELKNFEEKIYFDYLIKRDNPFSQKQNLKLNQDFGLKGSKKWEFLQKTAIKMDSYLFTKDIFLVLPKNLNSMCIWEKNFYINQSSFSSNKISETIFLPIEFSNFIDNPFLVENKPKKNHNFFCGLFFAKKSFSDCFFFKKQWNMVPQHFICKNKSEKIETLTFFYNFEPHINLSELERNYTLNPFLSKINFDKSTLTVSVIRLVNNFDFVSLDYPLGDVYLLENSQRQNLVQLSSNDYAEFIFRQKTRELAEHYNHESIEAITNLFSDFMGLIILLCLLINMKMSLMNTTAFLSESFFSLKDSKKAFLMLLFTDLLVGFHSPRGWEVIFHFLFEHFGLPENQNIIFLLVGTFPVLLDALFKYWIFRHLNRHSPATVATFQAMVE